MDIIPPTRAKDLTLSVLASSTESVDEKPPEQILPYTDDVRPIYAVERLEIVLPICTAPVQLVAPSSTHGPL